MIKIIDFYTLFCPQCKVQKPIVTKVCKEYDIELKLIECNEDESAPELLNKYNISSVPTLVILKDNNLVTSISGIIDETELKNIINDIK